MTFYKDRYLRPAGRFHTIWRAAHGIPVNPTAQEDDLMDICADLAQLMHPTRLARQQQQTLSLRLSTTLVAGLTARHAQLTDQLLQDAANLLDETQIRNNMENVSENDQMTVLNEDDCNGSALNVENISSIPQTRSPSDPNTSSSNSDRLQISETEKAYEICNEEQDKSMSTESGKENDDCDNNNGTYHGNDHAHKDVNNGENKSMSTEELNQSTNKEHCVESFKSENTINSGARQFLSQSSNTDPFDLLVTAESASVHDNISQFTKSNTKGNYETFQITENLHSHTHRSDNVTFPLMVTAEDLTSGQDAMRTPVKSNINQSTTALATYPSVSTRNEESSPIIHLSSDKMPRCEADTMDTIDQQTSENRVNFIRDSIYQTGAISSTTILETDPKSPNLESNIPDSRNKSPNIRRRSHTSTDQDNEEPTLKRIRSARDNLSGIQEVQEIPLDLTTKPGPFGECRAEINIPELTLDIRSPIHVEMDTQEFRISDLVLVENPTTPSERHATAVDPRHEDSNMNIDTLALDTSSWITMTDPTLSPQVLKPAETSAHTTQASLPPGTRGVVTAPATRRRRVRKPRATVYRARKVKMTRFTPPLTRYRKRLSDASLEEQNPLRDASIVTSHMTDQTSLSPSIVLQGNQSFTEIMEDQEMRRISLTQFDTSATETVQPQALIYQDTALSPTNVELPVIAYKNLLEDDNMFRISRISLPPLQDSDSIRSFEIAEQASALSPHITHQAMSSNQYDDVIVSVSSSPQCESQTIRVCAQIHQPPNESISVMHPASELVLSSTAEQNEADSLRRSSISQSTDSSYLTEADSTTKDVQQEMDEENEQVEEEQSLSFLQEPEVRRLETILEESESRYLEEHTVEKEISEKQPTEEFEEDNEIEQVEVNAVIDIQKEFEERDISNEHLTQRQTSSIIIDGEEEVPSLNAIIDDVQIYGELDISREDNEPIQNAASDVETTCSKDSLSTVSSLGLDCYSIIYKRDDPSRAVIMRSRVSDDPELNKYISRRWMRQFN